MRNPGNPERKNTRSGDPLSATVGIPPSQLGFAVIGIGVSAGGLAAFKDFLTGMTRDMESGCAIILVLHQAPGQSGELAEWIQPSTRMRVLMVEDNMNVRPGQIHVAPVGKRISLCAGSLHLTEFSGLHDPKLPVDFFFRSLATELGAKALGIILSGCVRDGVEGARAIQKAGGRIAAQCPGSAGFNGMPVGAIRAGLADYELEPADMPALLLDVQRPFDGHRSAADLTLCNIFKLLRLRTGYDFTHYKRYAARQALEHRMSECAVHSPAEYEIFLRNTPAELDCLFQQLLIGVTWFFRDPETFGTLAEIVSRTIMANRSTEHTIRVWIPGCSTGEEAYSIAMLLTEVMETLHLNCGLRVFATDIDAGAVACARAGVYPGHISLLVSPGRLTRYFTLLPDGGYRIRKSLRDVVVFSQHSLIKDPPFSKLDLIVCRNLLIYLNADVQKRTLSLFHYVLKPSGILMLGTSESTGDQQGLFAALDRKARIYQRQEAQAVDQLAWIGYIELPSLPAAGEASVLGCPEPHLPNSGRASTPVVLPPDGQHGPLGRDRRDGAATIIADLRQQLSAQDHEMRRTTEKLRSSNEELISSNEEQLCAIEELQATAEDLAISKDQLQILNEQLAALNAEMLLKMSALSTAKDDIDHFLDCTGIGTVFVDLQLRILRFNPLVSRILNLIPGDIGRPMEQISSNLVGREDLAAEVGMVLKILIGHEREVMTRGGLSFLMRIHPYRTLAGYREGAVISFTEITEMAKAREAVKQAGRLSRLAVVVHDAHDAVVMQDLEGRILAWNPAAARIYGWSEDEALRMNINAIIPKDRLKQELEILGKLGRAEIFEPYSTRRITRAGKVVRVSLVATALVDMAEVYAISTTERILEGAMP